MWYNVVMEMKKMTFAPGWVQTIDPANEKQDLLTYINDTHKAVYGYRPRWDREWVDSVTLVDLRAEAKSLEDEVVASIERDRAAEARRQAEMAAHHLAVSKAKKPISGTFKPFANLKEMLV
tara:strand:+ start:214 stop:576 length:363 start_codon:yes stop_codon:yes gene_type:complete